MDAVAAVLRQISIDQTTGCWNFTGTLNVQGYARVSARRGTRLGHRLVYEAHHGSLPRGVVLHHTCENRRCVNPAHLRPTTQAVHMRDLTPGTAAFRNARKTHCRRGHPLTPDNLEGWSAQRGRRKCRTCARDAERRYVLRKASQA